MGESPTRLDNEGCCTIIMSGPNLHPNQPHPGILWLAPFVEVPQPMLPSASTTIIPGQTYCEAMDTDFVLCREVVLVGKLTSCPLFGVAFRCHPCFTRITDSVMVVSSDGRPDCIMPIGVCIRHGPRAIWPARCSRVWSHRLRISGLRVQTSHS